MRTSRPSRRPSPRPSRRALGLLLLAVAALLQAGCRRTETEEVVATEKVPVATRPARRGSIRGVIAAAGTVRPAPGFEQLVTAPQPARILEIPKAEGDVVHKGDLLVRFDIPSLDADAATKRSDVERANARLESARASEQRVAGLFERGIAARKEVEDARRELAEAEAGVSEAASGRTAAGRLASGQTVRALFDGVVARRTHNPGDLVEAGGDPILRVIDPRALQVEAGVPLGAVAAVEVGGPARIFAPGASGKTADGAGNGGDEASTVVSRPASVDPATGAALVRLSLGASSRLPEGTPVTVEILGAEHKDAILVPADAIVREGADVYVFTVDAESKAHRVLVKTGVASRDEVEILSGLEGSEKVVIRGQQALPDGAEVSPES